MAQWQGKTRQHLLATVVGVFGLAATASAAPLRLSLDALATPVPSVEMVEPAPAAAGPVGAPDADEDLSFVEAPDLQFPPATAGSSPADEEWLLAASSQQDEGAAGAERRLGDFAPPVPRVLVERADPIDQVTLGAARPAAAPDAEASKPFTFALGGSAVGWLAAGGLALGLGMAAAWQGTHRKRARQPAPAGAAA